MKCRALYNEVPNSVQQSAIQLCAIFQLHRNWTQDIAHWSMRMQACRIQCRLDGGYNPGFLVENGGSQKNLTVLSFLLLIWTKKHTTYCTEYENDSVLSTRGSKKMTEEMKIPLNSYCHHHVLPEKPCCIYHQAYVGPSKPAKALTSVILWSMTTQAPQRERQIESIFIIRTRL